MRKRGGVPAFGVIAAAFVVYLLVGRGDFAGRGDFFYLADAFLHGRTWIDTALSGIDVIEVGERVYVPFGPFPAILFMPLVAITGAPLADTLEPVINALLAASCVGLGWMLAGRVGLARGIDRLWLVLLLAFSTPILWITTRGGVWHTSQLVATAVTLLALVELLGRRRGLVVGLLAGAAFLTRAPLAFAIPVYALWLLEEPAGADEAVGADEPGPGAGWVRRARSAWPSFVTGLAPAGLCFLAYNTARFGSPLESGYALAILPAFLEAQRAKGLFSLAHLGMNLDYLLLHLPAVSADPPFLRPDGLGMSIALTSPGLLPAAAAPWRHPLARRLLAAGALVLLPSLLYYGGGWLQYGYRYALDSIPFIWLLVALAAARRGTVAGAWKALIVIGMVVNAIGVYWAYRL